MWRRCIVRLPARSYIGLRHNFSSTNARGAQGILESVGQLHDQSSYVQALVDIAKDARSNKSSDIVQLSSDPRLSELVSLILNSPLNELSPLALSDLLASLAILKIKQPQLMEKFIVALTTQLPECKLRDISNILTAVTKLEFKSPDLLKAVAERVLELQSSLSPSDIIIILNCYAVFGVKHEKLLVALAQATQIHAQAGRFSSHQLSSILPGFGMFDHWNKGLLDSVRFAIVEKAAEGNFEASELLRIFKAMMFFRVKGEDMAEALCKHALTLADDMTPSEICGMWVAMGQHKFKNPRFVPVFTDRALQAAQKFSLSEVTVILVSLSMLKTQGFSAPESLVRRLCDILLARTNELLSPDVLSCLNAVAGLELRDRMDVVEALGNEAKKRTRDYSMQEGKQILEILQYMLGPAPEPEAPIKILRSDYSDSKPR